MGKCFYEYTKGFDFYYYYYYVFRRRKIKRFRTKVRGIPALIFMKIHGHPLLRVGAGNLFQDDQSLTTFCVDDQLWNPALAAPNVIAKIKIHNRSSVDFIKSLFAGK